MISRQRALCIIFSISLLMIMCASAWAETIRLKNGRMFEGIVADEKGNEVKILMKSGIVTFSRNEIDSIGDRKISPKEIKEAVKKLSAPTPAKKPVAIKTVKRTSAAPKTEQKKEQKAVPQVKQQRTPRKAAQPENLPEAAVVSTDTVPSATKAPISTPAVIFAIFVLAIFIFVIVLMIKRMKR
jgi:hypothetical protein